MVSLVNFKSVADDLQQHQQRPTVATNQQQATGGTDQNFREQASRKPEQNYPEQHLFSWNPLFFERAANQQQQHQETRIDAPPEEQPSRMHNLKLVVSNPTNSSTKQANLGAANSAEPGGLIANRAEHHLFCAPHLSPFAAEKAARAQLAECSPDGCEPPAAACCAERANFVVTWRNLRFAIEPKWHQRLAGSSLNPVAGCLKRRKQTPASANGETIDGLNGANQVAFGHNGELQLHQAELSSSGANPSNQNNASQQPETKIVLDSLDGSFKSGELAAILGPSGE